MAYNTNKITKESLFISVFLEREKNAIAGYYNLQMGM